MRPRPSPRSRLRAAVVVAAAALPALLAGPGCVERKLVIRSDPPGALVSLEDEPVGVPTPVEIPFEFDGVRRVTLAAPGHQVLETQARLATRWHDWFPLDFVAEFLWPGTIEDVQEFEYRLEPFAVPLDRPFTDEEKAALRERLDDLTARADEYRLAGSTGPGGTPETPAEAGAAKGGATDAAAPGASPPPARASKLPEIPVRRPPPRAARDVPPPTPPGQPLPPPVRPLPLEEPEKK